jgi:hypothetical protein
MRQIRQRCHLGEKEIMSLLMASETAMMTRSKLIRDHDTVNGIINGYYSLGRIIICLGRKEISEGKPRINTNRHELLSSFISVHSRPFAVQIGIAI